MEWISFIIGFILAMTLYNIGDVFVLRKKETDELMLKLKNSIERAEAVEKEWELMLKSINKR